MTDNDAHTRATDAFELAVRARTLRSDQSRIDTRWEHQREDSTVRVHGGSMDILFDYSEVRTSTASEEATADLMVWARNHLYEIETALSAVAKLRMLHVKQAVGKDDFICSICTTDYGTSSLWPCSVMRVLGEQVAEDE